jgi:threonine dehydrogenase-like Zn-dependent dehydrogenase
MNKPIKAVVIPAPGEALELQEFQLPELEDGGVLLKLFYADVCGTDVHLRYGKLAGVPYPLIPGHIAVGQIEKIHGTVKDVNRKPFREGDMVTFLDVHGTCQECWYCTVAKATTRCPDRKVYGITYGVKDGLCGGWAEKMVLKPGTRLVRLPQNVSPLQFATCGCGLPTAFHAVELAQIRLTDTVLIQGCGPVGLMATALAKLSGAGLVINTGAPELRLHAAQKMGAGVTIDITTINESQRQSKILELTGGRGVDIAIECTGNPKAVTEGMNLIRDNGRYVIVGQYTDHGEVEINPHLQINKKHLEIRGCWGIDFSHFYRAVKTLELFNETFSLDKMSPQIYSLADASCALDDIEQLKVIKAVLKIN